MGQVTIYLEDELERKMNEAVNSSELSKSKWIAQLVQEKLVDSWPESVTAMAGSWEDFPSLDEIRQAQADDVQRERL